jgi:cellulose synthase/poly-beta-1,6-N-acetylglucosamine synthase-like glycosyltransferase/peptidoglycan/xylan/chitin deacetylase (PgdA/CDA1 family)
VSHRRHREPRAHWILLALGLAVLVIELCFTGLVRHVGAEGIGPGPHTGPAARDIASGGPILHRDPDGTLNSQSMPAKTIALTFDDGPDPQWTPKVLDVLARHKAHATFFVIGSKVNDHPDLVRRILAEGNEVGSHTFTHAELSAVPGWRQSLELTLTQNAIAAATGRQVTLIRPPYSAEPTAVNENDAVALRAVLARGYAVVLTDVDTEDWRRPGVTSIVNAATPAPGAGAVVMLHDSGGDRSQTVAALDTLLTRLSGTYRFTTVSQGLGIASASPAASRSEALRGDALRLVQVTGEWLADAMIVLLDVAIVLAVIRLVIQVLAARIHVKRSRRLRRTGLAYLGGVSVVVPAYNEAANIAATVRSLAANDYPRVEVIVVDDGSSDDTAAIAAHLRLPNVRIIRQVNAGKPAALNAGVLHARHELLVFVDADTVLEPRAIGTLVQPFADPDVGGVSGNTKVANRRGFLGRWQHLEYVTGFNLDRRMFEVAECMPTVPGAIGAFRRSAFADVGGVSAATLAEDTDFTMAVIRAGWRVVYEESALAWTEVPASVRQLWHQRYRWCYGTMQAIWKHRHSLVEHGAGGKLGRRGLIYLMLFQILLPLAAPAVDMYALYGLLFLPIGQVAAVWFGLALVQMATCAYALRLDRESLRPLWVLPLQQVVYRQVMYLVVVQSAVTALTGIRLRWHRLARSGAASEALTR